jgi:hypothetical protein
MAPLGRHDERLTERFRRRPQRRQPLGVDPVVIGQQQFHDETDEPGVGTDSNRIGPPGLVNW